MQEALCIVWALDPGLVRYAPPQRSRIQDSGRHSKEGRKRFPSLNSAETNPPSLVHAN